MKMSLAAKIAVFFIVISAACSGFFVYWFFAPDAGKQQPAAVAIFSVAVLAIFAA